MAVPQPQAAQERTGEGGRDHSLQGRQEASALPGKGCKTVNKPLLTKLMFQELLANLEDHPTPPPRVLWVLLTIFYWFIGFISHILFIIGK